MLFYFGKTIKSLSLAIVERHFIEYTKFLLNAVIKTKPEESATNKEISLIVVFHFTT
jgi:hypothetical protein